jgi:hypothetical protein
MFPIVFIHENAIRQREYFRGFKFCGDLSEQNLPRSTTRREGDSPRMSANNLSALDMNKLVDNIG